MPSKPAKKPSRPVNVRFDDDLHAALLTRAAAEDRSMNATIREACRYYLAATEKNR